MRNPLQGGNNHCLLPLLEISKLFGEVLLQGHGCIFQYVDTGFGQMSVHLALIFGGTLPVNQLSLFQSVKNGGYRCLAEADFIGQLANGDIASRTNSLQQQDLGGGEPGCFGEMLGMQIGGPDYPAQRD